MYPVAEIYLLVYEIMYDDYTGISCFVCKGRRQNASREMNSVGILNERKSVQWKYRRLRGCSLDKHHISQLIPDILHSKTLSLFWFHNSDNGSSETHALTNSPFKYLLISKKKYRVADRVCMHIKMCLNIFDGHYLWRLHNCGGLFLTV